MAGEVRAATGLATEPTAIGYVSYGGDAARRLRRNKLAMAGAATVVVVAVAAALAYLWTPYAVWAQALGPSYSPPSMSHLLGLDESGRDILSRLMAGAQVSLAIGIGVTALSSVVGIVLGLLAGFYRGRVDYLISLVINIWYGVPNLLVALLFVVVVGPSLQNVMAAIAFTAWLTMARLVRGQALSLRERQFVEAARSVGARDRRILTQHILPNAVGPIIVQATYQIPQAIIFEAFLSFLGLGVPPPTPSWGAMAAQGFRAIQIAPHVILAPSLALLMTLMSFNFLGDGLRDALDPRLRR